ncbi:hypothetical protein BKA66DRAFT_454928 [Pyrenochaeta sp. MPI-SDFR-AT-0127]|nr:hypothetical protein BKA66DRAFT_454928 [Pyrenochaeta sp. MPI-SDFR-AT-0127]
MFFSQATLLMALASSATAHMTLNYPIPFNKESLNSSPLEPADFPCKQRPGVYQVDTMNRWDAGTTETVSFTGGATHGGGSCQFSITSDSEPTEQSQWKVIHSVIGGCPTNNTGNDSDDPAAHVAATFPVTMPSNVPDGRYTFAWSWVNKIGNREFYMNCAPIQVGSGSGSASTASVASALSALPDMFVVNLPYTECQTVEKEDFSYPDPGQSVVVGSKATTGNTLIGPGCARQNALGAGNGQLGSPSESLPNPGGVFAPGASSAPAASPSAPAAAPSAPAVKPSAPAAAPTTPAVAKPTVAPSTPSTTPEQPTYDTPQAPDNSNDTNTPTIPVADGDCTPCTNDGGVVCIGANQFGLCNRGCAVAQDLALGMACSNGVVVAATKRSIHFPRAHLHRRHGSSRFI